MVKVWAAIKLPFLHFVLKLGSDLLIGLGSFVHTCFFQIALNTKAFIANQAVVWVFSTVL